MSIDLSLSRLDQLLPHLPYTRPTIIITGNNSKGSSSVILTSILLSSSPTLRVGCFNSPLLISVLDCITLDNVPVSEAVYASAQKQVVDVDQEQGTKLTGFELLTLTALRVFETQKVEMVVLEVDIGSWLDATSIVPDACVLMSAVTAMDPDHQVFLRDPVFPNAREKVGIVGKGKPFVLGSQRRTIVEEVFKEIVGAFGKVLILALELKVDPKAIDWSIFDLDPTQDISPPQQPMVGTLKSFSSPLRFSLPLHGGHQLSNLENSLTVIDALLSYPSAVAASLDLKTRISPETITKGIRNVKWPGTLSSITLSLRLPPSSTLRATESKLQKFVVLGDGAYNLASAKTIGAYITHPLGLPLSSLSSSAELPEIIEIPITYILSLSQSPPMTPLQTLMPVLPPTLPSLPALGQDTQGKVTLRPSIALLRFTPPEGMPSVQAVPLSEMREAVRTLMPDLPEADLWVSPEEEDDNPFEEAFKWAVEKQFKGGGGLVVLAGSLDLVVDFLRLLERGLLKEGWKLG